jgi:hypothetical protein
MMPQLINLELGFFLTYKKAIYRGMKRAEVAECPGLRADTITDWRCCCAPVGNPCLFRVLVVGKVIYKKKPELARLYFK